MADIKITDLTTLATPATGDLLEVVDISDTSQSAQGSSKKVTIAAIKTTLLDTAYPAGSGTSTGTNTGDQTTIVGITGSVAEFNTALTGADFYTSGGTDVAIADGGTGASTAQAAIDALTAVSAATNEHVLTKDTASGNAIWKAAGSGSGDVVGPASATDNAIARYDTTTGKLLQNSGVTVSDVSGSSVTVASTAGNALAVLATAPAATTGASVAGVAASLTAGAAVASTDTAGAAAGGDVNITAGAAARLTSGNANGGNINLVPGAGIGTGLQGYVSVPAGGNTVAGVRHPSGGGISEYLSGLYAFASSAAASFWATTSLFSLKSGMQFVWSSNSSFPNSAADIGLARNAAGVMRVTNGSTGLGATLTSVLVEANTAGSGAPNVLVANESGTLLQNSGSTARNYHTLPTAAAGLNFEFVCIDADGIRITAASGDEIRVIDKVTAAAGYIESTTIGSVVRLIAVDATTWVAMSVHGVWTDGTFTYDDTSLTTP